MKTDEPAHNSAVHFRNAFHDSMTWEVDPEPVLDRSTRFVPIGAPDISETERQLVSQALQSGWLSGNTPIVEEFEKEFASRTGVPHAVSCNSGGMALVLMLRALGIGEGDEVIVPSFTMIATAAAVTFVGATPVFADCDADTLNIDPTSAERCVGPKTVAMLCVHLYGHPCNIGALRTVLKGIPLLEDAAEAHGSKWRGVACGAIGDAAAFGFYANKVVVCGEGGMVTTGDAEVASRVRSLRHYCFRPGRHFWHEDVGFSARLGALAAAVGLGQTRRLDELYRKRRDAADHYAQIFERTPVRDASKSLRLDPDSVHGWWHYWVRVQNRIRARAALAAAGIETRCGFVPMHVQPCYRDAKYPSRTDPKGCPAAEAAGREVMLLPTHGYIDAACRALIGEIVVGLWSDA